MVSAGNQCSGEDLDLVPKCPTAASPLQFRSTSFCKCGKYLFQEVHPLSLSQTQGADFIDKSLCKAPHMGKTTRQ